MPRPRQPPVRWPTPGSGGRRGGAVVLGRPPGPRLPARRRASPLRPALRSRRPRRGRRARHPPVPHRAVGLVRRLALRLAGRFGWRLARRRVRRAVPWVVVPASLGAGAVAVPAAAGALAVAGRRRRRRADSCGPHCLTLPEGRGDVITTADGAELALHVAGPADGPLVVLVHCWTGAKELWAPTARRLVHLGHRVVLYDQRGHGSSTWGDGVSDVDRLGDDLATVLAHVDALDAVVAGHSMGGMSIQA
ncbi:alpha/beta fold hydrolase [Actinomarinicola tropica]|uniref:Alpha/beta fold hydrolase n=1 Tax=Actinomarinicola tropica TaxID=2789776 RepID=A0A5Q2RGS7_9ACTN|nr:alpha/beta fold hydrolase [Actinomarinicola tropica]